MECYCGFVKRRAVRSRAHPYASIYRRILEIAQLNVTSLKYGLRKKLKLNGKGSKMIKDRFSEYPHYKLLAPRKRLKVNEGLRRQLADLIITRCSPDFGKHKIHMTTARKYIPDQLMEWGRAQLPGGGDMVKGSALINENRPARHTCCFVRYESLVDRNASNNLPEDLVTETFFAQLLRIVRLDIPPSPELYHLKSETVLLAHVVTCNTTQNEVNQWKYSSMGKTHLSGPLYPNNYQCTEPTPQSTH
ncbi:hypothetical protein BJ322DRAFT_1020924 [Thelephora terrestris]|uniref:Uncharacterized protein n=1 Tax=Thelephora terrestris TaxID=56493 RepID=A0A9P6HF37_9AGAM|nr:hypothetical protein BJ322DRAFT_1020924 [Thelephora terrestris]